MGFFGKIKYKMYKPYKMPVITAFPDVNVRDPRISKLTLLIARLVGWFYLFFGFGITKIVLRGDSYIDAFKRALAGKSRCILAFRHPNGEEPQILMMFTLFKLKAAAAKKKVRFDRNPHLIFLYGYEVARWGGPAARYAMPNVGALPIHHTIMDSKGMNMIYKAITEGPYPVALAPEGQVSYTSDSFPRLETGVVRIGFQAAQQLANKNSECPVEILPVSFHFRSGSYGKKKMNKLVKKIETACGFSRKEMDKLSLSERLRMCRDHILEINEQRYNIKPDTTLSFEERLEKTVNTALETAERMLGIKGEGDFFTRLYKVRHVCWDRIFLPDIDSFKNVSNVRRSVLDLKAGEAWHISRHQELADFAWYFRAPIPTEQEPLYKQIEYIQNLWDFASRTMGGAISDRVNLPRKVIIQAAPVINLTERLPQYKEDKKAAIAACMSDLEKAYLDCIDEVNKEERKT